MRAMRTAVAVLSLTLIWVLLWGAASPANIVSGLAVGVLLVLVLPSRLARPVNAGRVRPGTVARLAGYMAVNVVKSNLVVIRDILSRQPRLHTGIVAVDLPECSDEVVTLITNLLAVTPGTMPLEISEQPRALFVHVLHLEDPAAARRGILHLVALCVRSFGSDDDVASLKQVLAASA